jgi:hypothetical protein
MSIFEIKKNTFAIGTNGKRAAYVVTLSRGKARGVRGQRPLLDSRYKKANPGKVVTAALKAAIA